MYTLKITPINTDAVGSYFNQWLRENYTFDGIGYFSDNVSVTFEDEPNTATKTEIVDKYQSLTSSDIIPTYEIKKIYTQRTQDGVDFFDDVRSDVALQYINLTLTQSQCNYIENKLKVVKSMILTGDWITGQYEITNNVVVDGVVSPEDTINGYTQKRHDKIKSEIDLYVTENY